MICATDYFGNRSTALVWKNRPILPRRPKRPPNVSDNGNEERNGPAAQKPRVFGSNDTYGVGTFCARMALIFARVSVTS